MDDYAKVNDSVIINIINEMFKRVGFSIIANIIQPKTI